MLRRSGKLYMLVVFSPGFSRILVNKYNDIKSSLSQVTVSGYSVQNTRPASGILKTHRTAVPPHP